MNELRYIFARLIWNFDIVQLNPECSNWHVQKAWLAWDKGPLKVALKQRETRSSSSFVSLWNESKTVKRYPGLRTCSRPG